MDGKKYRIGYTQGVYDMFHIGHLNLINEAKQYCEKLIVGVNADALVQEYKHKTPVINENERRYIVGNIKAVDECIIATTLDKFEAYHQIKFDAIFIGADWEGNPRWIETQQSLSEFNVDVLYLPYTQGVCSTDLRQVKDNSVKG